MAAFNAVVMAAGRGTRMRSRLPKVMHELCGRPLVAWPVLAAREAGAANVVVVRSPDIEIASALPDGTIDAIQQPTDDGTAGAVAAALPALAGSELPVVVINGDVPLVSSAALESLVDFHCRSGAPATIATAILNDASGYGRVVRDTDDRVDRVVETKATGDATPSELEIREVNGGIYCFEAAALAWALPQVGSDNAQNERYLPDVLGVLRADGRPAAAHVVDDEALLLGINDRAQLAQVERIARDRIAERHMLAGVTIRDPASTLIDVEVQIAQDVVIEPATQLRGRTVIGEGASVGPATTVTDSSIAAGATVRNAVLDRAVVSENATVGPFAYLRPGTEVGTGAKIGSFVEVKNSVIGEGAKVPHLSYIGDADVGAGTNLGAVTITANYNGKTKKKSRTTIGPGVRTGVLTALVAPVELGAGAYTAAGSVVTEDVPPDALAVSRGRQRNIDGYGSR